eukprot:8665286-Pyramimonas_sp.AAC.1
MSGSVVGLVCGHKLRAAHTSPSPGPACPVARWELLFAPAFQVAERSLRWINRRHGLHGCETTTGLA